MKLRLALAVLLPFAACGLQWLLWDAFIKPYVWFLFFPAAFFSAWLGGLRGGLAGTVIGALLVWFVYIPPQFSFELRDPAGGASIILFVVMGGLFAWFFERLRDALRRSDEARAAAEGASEKIARLYEKTLELDALKSQFFANVSHELRTPLTLILAPLQRRLAAAGGTPAEREETRMMLRNARLLYRHVSDLLDAAKVEAGRMGVDWARVDLAELARWTSGNFDSTARERGIAFTVTAPQTLPCEADGEKVQRIVLNLLANAFKFTPDGGSIALRVAAADGSARIEVQDSGPGVPADQRAAVFERFRQGEGEARRHHGGTGLGLAIVKDFAELHGGSVALAEAPGGGALFAVTLPLAAPGGTVLGKATALDAVIDDQAADELRAYPAPIAPELSDPSGRPDAPLVLVVEDNPDMRAFIMSALRPHYRVAGAFDGRDGLDKAEALAPDLIIADVMMPDMSGDDMALELRRRPAMADVPIVMLTARADDALRVRLLQAGVQDYIAKPFAVDELLARVGGLVAARRRTVAELQRSAARLRRLAEVVEGIAAVRDLPALMAIVRHAVRELTGADGATLVLRDNGQCHYVDEDAIGPLWKGQRFPLESCISGWAMLHAEAVVIEDIYADPRIPHAAYRTTFVKSLSMVPVGRATPVGAIGCYWAAPHRASGEEVELQQALADAMSVGLANLELMQRSEAARRAAEQAAAAAQDSAAGMREAQRLGHVGSWSWDPRRDTAEWSEEMFRILGRDPAAGTANFGEVQRYFSAESWERLGAAVRRVADEGGRYEVEGEVVRPDGTRRWVLSLGEAVRDAAGAVVLVRGVLQDISEHKAAEDALRRQAEELRLRNAELERFDRAAVGREIEMIELKRRVNQLAQQLGQTPPFDLGTIDAALAEGKGEP